MKCLALVMAAATIGCGNPSKGTNAGCTTLAGGTACFNPLAQPAVRTPCGEIDQYCDATAMATPNLACLAKPATTRPTTPDKVTLTGFVRVFSSGPDANGLAVQVFDAALLQNGNDPGNGVPVVGAIRAALDPKTLRACDIDAAKGCSVPLVGGCAAGCNDGLGGTSDTPKRDDHKYCRNDGAGGECSDRLRWEPRYAIANVPTNKPLVIRVTAPGGGSDATWATTVTFNVFLSTTDRACASPADRECLDLSDAAHPSYQLDVTALSQSDYLFVPTLSGLSGGITAGKGAVMGEVRDCDDVRVANVAVMTTPGADRFTYFNGNPLKTLPDPGRASVGTDRLGLFAAFNVAPGKVKIETAGIVKTNDPISFGAFDAFVYGNTTLTIVNVNGGKGTR